MSRARIAKRYKMAAFRIVGNIGLARRGFQAFGGNKCDSVVYVGYNNIILNIIKAYVNRVYSISLICLQISTRLFAAFSRH